jgi:hypothetical protein
MHVFLSPGQSLIGKSRDVLRPHFMEPIINRGDPYMYVIMRAVVGDETECAKVSFHYAGVNCEGLPPECNVNQVRHSCKNMLTPRSKAGVRMRLLNSMPSIGCRQLWEQG